MLLSNLIRKINSFQIYMGLLIALAVSFPLSKASMSIITGLLMANWLIEGRFQEKFTILKERKSILLIISIFFIYLLGLLWTDNLQWGLHDLRIQIPLLLLPLVIGTSQKLDYLQLKRIIYFFSAGVVISSLISIWVLLGLSSKIINDPREMSLFISHIRFSLLINISIFSLGWYFFNHEKKSILEKVLLAITMLWLSIFLVILKSATGWVVFVLVLAFVTIIGILKIKKLLWRFALLGFLLSLLILPLVYIAIVVHEFYDIEPLPEKLKGMRTKQGNFYEFDFNNHELENGNYTFYFYCEPELRESWGKRSRLNYDSIANKGFDKYVLKRYLTSKGYRKDAEGVEKLTDEDIRNIENGMTNYRFTNPFSFYNRIYQIVWEIDFYRKGGNPSGHSVTQRLEYYKMAWSIISENFWFGTGTGGYFNAYQEKYNQSKFFKQDEYRQRSHNMFLSYWIGFGLIGLVYICYALFSPIFMEHKSRSFLLMVFMLIVVISFMNEDTLNNHDAITFFSFFYPLHLYSSSTKPPRAFNSTSPEKQA